VVCGTFRAAGRTGTRRGLVDYLTAKRRADGRAWAIQLIEFISMFTGTFKSATITRKIPSSLPEKLLSSLR
jgi:uncharacterized membrane protein YoaK (UPF0700 family)